ncbi:MAG: hypothetical protein EA001_00160 [Oscillatoriales cyanobacterium]|nr:MAG: hypothetical protein EA001_00160 [Oscillatoriales cyanobacterium]
MGAVHPHPSDRPAPQPKTQTGGMIIPTDPVYCHCLANLSCAIELAGCIPNHLTRSPESRSPNALVREPGESHRSQESQA